MRLSPIPEPESTYQRIQELNPAYRGNATQEIDPRALRDICKPFFRNGEEEPPAARTHNDICRNLRCFIVSLVSRTKQMEGNNYWAQRRAESEDAFRASSRTLLKTVQEILCDPADLMLAEKTVAEWIPPEPFEIEALVIDPRRITDQLLHDLGLTQFVPPKGIRAENKLALRAQAIPEIKEMMRFLEPILEYGKIGGSGQEMNYFRLTRMTKGSGRGYILGTQHTVEGDKKFFRTDIFGAERRAAHVEASMKKELETLTSIEYDLRVVHEDLGNWMDIKNTERVDELKAKLFSDVETLQFAQVAEKRALKDKIKECLDFKDSRGQTNPGAIRAKMLRAFEHLGHRVRNIERMHGYIAWDQAKIVQMIVTQNTPFEDFRGQVETVGDKFKIFSDAEPLTSEIKARIIANLRIRRREAEKMKFEPFLTLGETFCAQIDSVIANLEQGNAQDARKEFIKIYLLTKLGAAYMAMMRLLRRISLNPDEINAADLHRQIDRIHSEFREHKVDAQTEVNDYYSAFGEMHHLFNGVKKELFDFLEKPDETAPKTIREAAKRMKERIKGFDFVGMLRKR